MGLLKISTFAAAVCMAIAAPLEGRGSGNCADGSQFSPAITNGDGNAGSVFCETNWGSTYTPITHLTIWFDQYNIQGIQATYSDGTTSPVHGTASGTASSIGVDYAKGERWTQWTSWFWIPQYSYGNDYLTSLVLSASNGQSIDTGIPPDKREKDGFAPYAVSNDVGSGILMGFNGTADGAIHSLAPLFLNSDIANIQISDVNFPAGPTGSQNINIDSLASAHYYNGQDEGTSGWNFQNSQAITNTYTFTQGTTNTYGTSKSISFTLMIPKILNIGSSTSFTWSTAYATSNSNTYTETVTVTWAESGTLQPGQGVNTVAEVGHGQGTFPYTATVTITLNNGNKFSFTEGGTITINDISQAVVEVTSANYP